MPGNLRQGGGSYLLLVLQSGGVHHGELKAAPISRPIDPVTGRTRDILDDSPAFSDQAVEESGLADVRPADNGNDRLAHEFPNRLWHDIATRSLSVVCSPGVYQCWEFVLVLPSAAFFVVV